MKILFFILSLVVFRPLQAQADTVFNDAESFTVAKAIRLGRDSSNSQALGQTVTVGGHRTGNSSALSQSITGGATNRGCAANKYKNSSNVCVACPSNGYCNGSDSWACKPNYWQNKSGGSCVGCTTSTTDCAGGTEYTCKGLNTWSNSSKWRDNSKADPSKCVNCPNSYTECNGTTSVRCLGAGTSGRSNYKASNALDSGDSDATKKCKACPSNAECIGTSTYYCKGYSTSKWNKDYYRKNGSSCSTCVTNGVCNGTGDYWCTGVDADGNGHWKRGTANAYKDGSSCTLCQNNNYDCNGKTRKCHGTNSDGTASSSYLTDYAYKSGSSCIKCPDYNECNGESKQCLGKKAGTWNDQAAWDDNGTCRACPANAECKGTSTYECKGDSTWKNANKWRNGSSCQNCPSNAVCKRNNTEYYCVSGTYRNGSGSCVSCSSSMNYSSCPGETAGGSHETFNFSCKDGYFKYSGSTSTTCTAINTSSVVECADGFSVRVASDSNTIYCVQPY